MIVKKLIKQKKEFNKSKIVIFKQKLFYYKFNLKLPNLSWIGTKGCRKKYLKNPQWLRNIKVKNQDKLFNKI